MTTQEFLSSGILELYIAGALNESESAEITKKIADNPTLAIEVERIERVYCEIGMSDVPDILDINILYNILTEIDYTDNQLQSSFLVDSQEILSSGILELYVAGALSTEESIEIAHLVAEDSHLQAEVEKIEKTFIQMSILEAPPLDEYGLVNILHDIDSFEEDSVEKSHPLSFVSTYNGQDKQKEDSPKEYDVYSFVKNNRYYAAAAVLLLMISAGASLFMMNEFINTSNQLAVLEIDNTKVIDGLQAGYSNDRERFMNNSVPTLEVLLLPKKKDAPNMEAIIYWNNQKGDIYIEASKLPIPPKGKQWQVWAEIPNVVSPYSLGVLSKMDANKDNFFQLQSLQKHPNSFFITLEPIGGSLLPSPQQIYLKTNNEVKNI